MSYAELYCLSHYSFLRGASSPEQLVKQAESLGYQALAITDECSVAGAVKAWQAAKHSSIKVIIGSEFRTQSLGRWVLLCQNREGYAQLSAFITKCRRAAEKGSYQFIPEWLLQVPLSCCLCIWLPPSELDTRAHHFMQKMSTAFQGRLWIGYLRSLAESDIKRHKELITISQQYKCPLVSCSGALFHHSSSVPLHEVMSAIREGCKIDELGTKAERNAERTLRTLGDIKSLYAPEYIKETLNVADLCSFDLGSLRYEYPSEVVPPDYTPDQWLRKLTLQGAKDRYPEGLPSKVRKQIEYELKLVRELGYAHFFLTIHDIVSFARAQGILHQGRGSAANSSVCYCLGITAVNPAQSDLLFERFISKERNEPPDIDVDFEHERREEVIQYIYQKYGRERAALAATVITYRLRSAIRDVGKALGFSEGMLAELLARLDRRDSQEGWAQQLMALGIEKHPRGSMLVKLVSMLLGTPRHLSQHVGGFIISSGPLSELVPVENASMPERTVIQWDKDDLESLCLLKVDVLALGMLTALRKGLSSLPEFYGDSYDLASIPQEDKQVYGMLQKADSIGVFQIESRAQMSMLPRLKPATFYDLVIQVAIVRPGPIQGDMVHPYLRRRDGLEPIEYPSDEVADVLRRTLGVPIFQEQVIKLAMVAAGFSGGEADQLRRAMASWKSHGQLEPFRYKLVKGMLARGYPESFAERLYAQILGFGEYGFPESHAASFAILAYASAWLKYHYPAAFYVGLLNSLPMGFYSPSQLIQDAKRHGVVIHPVCINQSGWDHALHHGSRGPEIRLGFRLVKGVRYQDIELLLASRPSAGFSCMREIQRIQIQQGSIEALASADAFSVLANHRYQSRWELTELGEQLPLLESLDEKAQINLPAPHPIESMKEDYNSMGLTLGAHPVALLRQYLKGKDSLPKHRKANELPQLRHGQIITALGLVTGRQRPGTSKGVTFITLEDDTGNINVVLWQDRAREQRQEWLHARLLLVRGILEIHGDVIHVIAGRMRDYTDRLPAAHIRSRNFH
ncbi:MULTISPECIES: error-prone DNA polymerase [Gammaproteobacteria]|uniref:error-prone DNA polymerase n=1 Tax=Gammaproteobacteria TaxID=1236 RepID=UPI000DCFF472|nr:MULTISPECIES: error-prone DNA polymerase [Gammaproteobacteria]RTE86767.1 DNA polymerase III subunit alpha [Aliidiomarina sp. B3213]TCZ90679.1 DNA polymerase III subunit alpha [Lysobacter sp. N42]